MTTVEKHALHAVLLQTLRAVGELGRPADRLLVDLRAASFTLSLPALEVELRELVDKRWIGEMPQDLGAARYRLAPLGRNVLELQGL